MEHIYGLAALWVALALLATFAATWLRMSSTLCEIIIGIGAGFIATQYCGDTALGKDYHCQSRQCRPAPAGDPRACYVVWEDGEVRFCRSAYDTSQTIAALAQAPLPGPVITQLTSILRTGGAKGY